MKCKSSYIETSLRELFERLFERKVTTMSPVTGSGSDRQYFRMSSDGISCIATYSPDAVEGRSFVRLAQNFYAYGIAVPKIFAVSPDFHFYLQEDLGNTSLFSELGTEEAEMLIKDTLIRLINLQKSPENLWMSNCFNKEFCRRQALWDLNYFKYEYLKPRNVVFDEEALEDDFEKLSDRLLGVPAEFWGFMMRDCQSRNVMITSDGPVFIDFQGGRRGPALYDAVSFLWQARAGFHEEFRMTMLDFYCLHFCEGDEEKKDRMMESLNDFVLFRTLQVLGAYGFRGLVQNKSHFLRSIPGALSNLGELIKKGVLDEYPELKHVCEALVNDPLFTISPESEQLEVEVFSFSYKKGYPFDLSGNGGGFMFDCRAMHNPGRYKEYKELTGRDAPVIDFLEKRGEVQSFLKNAWSLTDPAIERYITRGFSHLQIGFGCTGGQHRSVYCAEHTAAHIQNIFPEAKVILVHREHTQS